MDKPQTTKKTGYIDPRLHTRFGIKTGGSVEVSSLGEGVIGCVLVMKEKSKDAMIEVEYGESND